MAQYKTATTHRQYDVTPDDQRFAMVSQIGVDVASELVLIENWFELLKDRVGR